ncbi:GntR family transcriptional regulator [Streptomyces goshikiensis]|uniref:GntR family transcriptional regulator n=1 Tax=Streptomyces goshikiensis TaxID=1942 RepID=UPI003690C0BB
MSGYEEIAGHYRNQMKDRALNPGDRMPTYGDVVAEFQVNRTTAIRAYDVLEREGRIFRSAGRPTVVTDPGSPSVVARVASHAATGRALAVGETSQILEVGMVRAEGVVAARLEVEPGTTVHVRRRLVSRDGVPTHMSSSYYTTAVVEVTPELAQMVSTGGSRELAAERLGSPQKRLRVTVTPRLATEPEKEALGLAGVVPIAQEVRTVSLEDGRVVEVAVKVSGENGALNYDIPLG